MKNKRNIASLSVAKTKEKNMQLITHADDIYKRSEKKKFSVAAFTIIENI